MVNNVEEFKRIIGLNIEHKRKKAKMTQEKLAELLGVTVRSVYNYEKGKTVKLERPSPVWYARLPRVCSR